MPLQLPARLPKRDFRLRADHVCDGFRLRQIDPPVEKSSPGEFARFGQPGARVEDDLQDAHRDSPSTVAREFRRILARVGVGRTVEGQDPVVHHLPGAAIPKMTVAGDIRGPIPRSPALSTTKNVCDDGERIGPGYPDDRNPAFTRWCGYGGDRVVVSHNLNP